MIKGHTKIELFDAATGNKEFQYEKDNLVTNAVQELIAFNTMIGRGLNDNVFPISTNALGGIMLFDSALDEDVKNVNFPSNAKLVGYAARDTNSSDTMRGSLNAVESHETANGYVSVWDFGTSQANGVIKSIALTSAYSGVNPFQRQICGDFKCEMPTIEGKEYDARPICVKDGYLYWICSNGLNVTRCRFDAYKAKINDHTFGSVSQQYENVATLKLPEGYTSFDVSGCAKYWMPCTDGYLYLITQNNSSSSYTYYGETHYNYYYDQGNDSGDAKIHITKYKMSDLSFEMQAEEVYTLTGAHILERNEGSLVVNKGYLYVRSKDNRSIYIVNLSNNANVKSFTVDNSGTVTYISPMLYNGGIQYQYNYSKSGTTYTKTGFLYPSGEHSEETTTGGAIYLPSIYYSDGKVISTFATSYGYGTKNSILLKSAYLGTINNLSNSVTKKASQTMKITYTLTDKEG
ncbi:MAG: hypothetical protein ACI4CX_07515 [Candidatus Weimeria sp.]